MTTWVLDASVVVKWFLRDRPEEESVPKALAVADALQHGRIDVLQPPHWLAEVAAVLARLAPDKATRAVSLLASLELRTTQDIEVYRQAIELAARLDHHLFDTLYHAVALQHPSARFLTADRKYLRKTHGDARVVGLADFPE